MKLAYPAFAPAKASAKGKCCERRRRSRAQCLSACTGVVDYEENESELWFVARDSEDRVTGTICFDEDSIENIETDDENSFLVDFMYDMTGVDISETIF